VCARASQNKKRGNGVDPFDTQCIEPHLCKSGKIIVSGLLLTTFQVLRTVGKLALD